MTPRTVLIVCAKAPRRMPVPAVRGLSESGVTQGFAEPHHASGSLRPWTCSYCGARVKVVA